MRLLGLYAVLPRLLRVPHLPARGSHLSPIETLFSPLPSSLPRRRPPPFLRSAATSKRPRTAGGRGGGGSTVTPPKPVTYADLGGIEPILDDIRELIEYPLKHPEVGGWGVAGVGRGHGEVSTPVGGVGSGWATHEPRCSSAARPQAVAAAAGVTVRCNLLQRVPASR